MPKWPHINISLKHFKISNPIYIFAWFDKSFKMIRQALAFEKVLTSVPKLNSLIHQTKYSVRCTAPRRLNNEFEKERQEYKKLLKSYRLKNISEYWERQTKVENEYIGELLFCQMSQSNRKVEQITTRKASQRSNALESFCCQSCCRNRSSHCNSPLSEKGLISLLERKNWKWSQEDCKSSKIRARPTSKKSE